MELATHIIRNLEHISNSISMLKAGRFEDKSAEKIKATCRDILQDVEIFDALVSEGTNFLLTAYAAMLQIFLLEVESIGEMQPDIDWEHFDTVYNELFKVKYQFEQMINERLGRS